MPVLVVADATFRRESDWRPKLESDLNVVRRLFLESYGIEFELRRWLDVDDCGPVSSIDELYAQLTNGIRAESELLVLIFTGRTIPSDDARWEPAAGAAPYFGRIAVIRLCPTEARWRFRRETIAHEIAHLMGAWHSTDENSVMRLHPHDTEVLRFDQRTDETLRRFATIAFAMSVDQLSPEDVSFITKRFRGQHISGEMHPIAHVLARRACERLARREYDLAEDDIVRARKLAIEGEDEHCQAVEYLDGLLASVEKLRSEFSLPGASEERRGEMK